MASEALKQFDNLVQHCFSECFGIDTTTESRLQAQLSPSRGGLGLRSLFHHSSAAYIASLCISDCTSSDDLQLNAAIDLYNVMQLIYII